MNRVVFATLAILCMLSASSIMGFVHSANADAGTIYINADGSISPSDTSILTVDNITYMFTGNIVNESIVVQRDNIVLEGAGFTIHGNGTGNGITASNVNNVTINNTNIENFLYGTHLEHSSNNTISEDNITNNGDGILLDSSSNNSISGNNMTNNMFGIWLDNSSNNSISGSNITENSNDGIHLHSSTYNIIFGNTIKGNSYEGISLQFDANYNTISGNDITANGYDGIGLYSSSSNIIFHNNFVNNTKQVYTSSADIWDDSYPSGGNYWSDYNGTDNNQDGIADAPYVIDTTNLDHYPLMGTCYEFFPSFFTNGNVSVNVISNSTTISDLIYAIWLSTPYDGLQAGQQFIQFSTSGQNESTGFCRVSFPTAIMNGTYKVFVNDTEVPYNLLPFSNSNTSYLYFTYKHSTEQVVISPEFPSVLVPSLLMIATILAVMVYRKRRELRFQGLPRSFSSKFFVDKKKKDMKEYCLC